MSTATRLRKMSSWHPSVRGAVVGAAVGALGRAVVLLWHLTELGSAALPIVVLAMLVAAAIGAVAGTVRHPGLAALLGAALTTVIFLLTLPVAFLIELLGAASAPTGIATVAVGALSGLAGAISAGRRRMDHAIGE
jgi:hypothetical protein